MCMENALISRIAPRRFYALLDELQDEADKLMDKGISGVGAFECQGARSGGLQRSSVEGKHVMIKAAEKRRRVQEDRKSVV